MKGSVRSPAELPLGVQAKKGRVHPLILRPQRRLTQAGAPAGGEVQLLSVDAWTLLEDSETGPAGQRLRLVRYGGFGRPLPAVM